MLEKLLEINKYHLKTEQISLNTLIDEETGETVLDYIRTGYGMENSVISKMNCENILASIIDETVNYDIVIETLGLNDEIPKTREELAEKHGISYQRIDKKYKKAYKK